MATKLKPPPASPPYTIPPVLPPDPATLKQVDSANILEFFRVEALLRSATVMALYEKAYKRDSAEKIDSADKSMELWARYWITWDVLKGIHYRYLHLEQQRARGSTLGPRLGPGITDILSLFDGSETGAQPSPRCLYVEIDTTVRPKIILDTLGKLLQQRYKNWKEKPPVMRKVEVWFKYFECYDLLAADPQLSYGDIAKHVFNSNTPNNYERVEKAISHVRKLIDAAEQNHWPPRNLSL